MSIWWTRDGMKCGQNYLRQYFVVNVSGMYTISLTAIDVGIFGKKNLKILCQSISANIYLRLPFVNYFVDFQIVFILLPAFPNDLIRTSCRDLGSLRLDFILFQQTVVLYPILFIMTVNLSNNFYKTVSFITNLTKTSILIKSQKPSNRIYQLNGFELIAL